MGRILDGVALLPELAGGVPVAPVWILGAPAWRSWRHPPLVEIMVLDPQPLHLPDLPRAERRRRAVRIMEERLEQAALRLVNPPRTLWGALCRAAREHGRGMRAIEDSTGARLTHGALLWRSLLVARVVRTLTEPGERVGLLLPTTAGGVVVFFALQAIGRVPALLNFSAGAGQVLSACRTARLRTVLTARRFVTKANLEPLVETLSGEVRVFYLEDLQARITHPVNLAVAWWRSLRPVVTGAPQDEGVILFTSGSEGEPKGVALSQGALLANIRQVQVRVGLRAVPGQDLMLNVLPMFHAFGLTVATLTPLFSGVRLFLHPSPLDYRLIAELAYLQKPSLIVGTDTFLAGYARVAHPGDFCGLRLAFAGGEPLRERTRLLWLEKFGVPVYEGYGGTETGPALAVNIPMANRPGTVGRLLPGIRHRLLPVEGLNEGGRLVVSGPNLMLGYLTPGGDGRVVPVALGSEAGWYDTGDVVTVDEDGFVRIAGRARRFAKIGGEMVSLAAVEALAEAAWPECRHAAVTLPDPQKGERIVLVTEYPTPDRATLLEVLRVQGLGALHLPARLVTVASIPMLGPGKTDFLGVRALVEEHCR